MVPTVTVHTEGLPELYHSARVLVGLDALARRGRVALRFARPPVSPEGFLGVQLTVAPAGGSERRAFVDLSDHSDRFALPMLRWADVYWKRSLYRPDAERLEPDLRAKLVPFGLNYACRSSGNLWRLVRAFGGRFVVAGLRGYRAARGHLALPTVAAFEQEPDAPVEPAVMFQTRIWEAHEFPFGSDEADRVNEERVELVRALRGALGDRFRGGLVPTPLALARYPNEVTRVPSRRTEYVRASKRNLISIYTRGLFHSTAFKLPEALAAAQCVVAEPPRNELPVQLEPGTHYLPFGNAAECVAACRELLADPARAARMRRANAAYYRAEVEPARHAANLLATLCAPARAAAGAG